MVLFASGCSKDSPIIAPSIPNEQAPSIPSAPISNNITSKYIFLEWVLVNKADGYRLYKNDFKIYEGKDFGFKDTTVTPKTNYTYTISAFNKVGESPKSLPVTFKTKEQILIDVVDDPKYVDFLNGK